MTAFIFAAAGYFRDSTRRCSVATFASIIATEA
jgi:hypothetical protein